jgi:hypothetical protein
MNPSIISKKPSNKAITQHIDILTDINRSLYQSKKDKKLELCFKPNSTQLQFVID